MLSCLFADCREGLHVENSPLRVEWTEMHIYYPVPSDFCEWWALRLDQGRCGLGCARICRRVILHDYM